MLLLRQKMNSKLRSGSFDIKREIYNKSDLLLTKMLAKYEKWNKENIEDRQNYMADLAIVAWTIKP